MPASTPSVVLRPRYQPFYCEENIYLLAGDPALRPRRREVVFISNAARACAVWNQRLAPANRAMLWDYHVVLLCSEPSEVFDLDTRLGAPCDAGRYVSGTFRASAPDEYLPRFRVVDADVFLERFASDRTHMLDDRGGYVRPPPPWPPIGAPGAPSNLDRWIDMTTPYLGEVIDLATLAARVSA